MFFFKIRTITRFLKKTKNGFKNRMVGFFKKARFFLNADELSIHFCDFPLIPRSETSHVTISVIGRAPY